MTAMILDFWVGVGVGVSCLVVMVVMVVAVCLRNISSVYDTETLEHEPDIRLWEAELKS
jgi:hypothetical protein